MKQLSLIAFALSSSFAMASVDLRQANHFMTKEELVRRHSAQVIEQLGEITKRVSPGYETPRIMTDKQLAGLYLTHVEHARIVEIENRQRADGRNFISRRLAVAGQFVGHGCDSNFSNNDILVNMDAHPYRESEVIRSAGLSYSLFRLIGTGPQTCQGHSPLHLKQLFFFDRNSYVQGEAPTGTTVVRIRGQNNEGQDGNFGQLGYYVFTINYADNSVTTSFVADVGLRAPEAAQAAPAQVEGGSDQNSAPVQEQPEAQ